MKTIYKEILQLAVAFLLTGSIANAMAPTQSAGAPKVEAKSIVKVVPVKKVIPIAVPVKAVTWQDNPNKCTDSQFIAAEAPFTCIDKQVAVSPARTPQASSPVATGSHADWMAAAGIVASDYGYVDYIISHESGWNPNAVNSGSSAEGLPQALPYSKTGCAHGDAICQLRWASSYATGRYGSWVGAYSFWTSNRWW